MKIHWHLAAVLGHANQLELTRLPKSATLLEERNAHVKSQGSLHTRVPNKTRFRELLFILADCEVRSV
jgi:hypothetical protein